MSVDILKSYVDMSLESLKKSHQNLRTFSQNKIFLSSCSEKTIFVWNKIKIGLEKIENAFDKYYSPSNLVSRWQNLKKKN